MGKIFKRNKKYIILSFILFIVELLIALFLHDDIIRPYIGDILVVVLIYCIVRSFIMKKITLLPLYVFIFAAFVEILQYFDIVSKLNLENNAIARILIGSTFDWSDIMCYAAGALISFVIQWMEGRA